jgi:predicted transcriptional regulator
MRLSKEKMKFETELRKQQTRQEIQEERERDRIASLERKARMVRMREEGMTYREIAEREKVTDRYVMRVVRGR